MRDWKLPELVLALVFLYFIGALQWAWDTLVLTWKVLRRLK